MKSAMLLLTMTVTAITTTFAVFHIKTEQCTYFKRYFINTLLLRQVSAHTGPSSGSKKGKIRQQGQHSELPDVKVI